MLSIRRVAAVLAAASLALVTGPWIGIASASPDQTDGVVVEADYVYVVVGNSLRNPDSLTDPAAPLFNRSAIALNLTWGEWSAARATSVARTAGGPSAPRTDVRLELAGLVPNGVYSVFYVLIEPDSTHPLCPNERHVPLDAFQPDRQVPERNAFVAGADGRAEFRGVASEDLLAARQVYVDLVYHFSGRTYYPFPNHEAQRTSGPVCSSVYGEDSMVHLHVVQKIT